MSISFLMLIFTIGFILMSFKTDYMNCWKILDKHLDMFRTDNGKIPFIFFFTYSILPFILGIVLSIIKNVNKDIVSIITIIVSILTSMLFTLLVMIIDLRNKYSQKNNNDTIVASEVYYSIMFEIFISIVILIALMMYIFSFNSLDSTFFSIKKSLIDLKDMDNLARFGFSIVIYGLNLLLLFNLFIILKRVFNLVEKSIGNKE